MSRISDTKYTPIKGNILRETDKAIQFEIEEIAGQTLEDRTTMWFPLSQMKSITRSHSTELDSIEVAEWILKKAEFL